LRALEHVTILADENSKDGLLSPRRKVSDQHFFKHILSRIGGTASLWQQLRPSDFVERILLILYLSGKNSVLYQTQK